jgi:hypothetical protein
MSQQQPQVFDIDPEKAPRMTAIILLVCGLMGVGFLLVNMLGTGDDPYYNEADWDNGTEPVHQRYDIMPNMVRGKQETGYSDEDEEAQDVPTRRPIAKPTSNPFLPQLHPTPATPPTVVPGMPGAVPGMPATPGSGTTPGLVPRVGSGVGGTPGGAPQPSK